VGRYSLRVITLIRRSCFLAILLASTAAGCGDGESTGIDQLAVDQATATASSGDVKIMMITRNVYIEVEITTPGGTEALGDLADEQRAAAIQLAESVVAAFQSQGEAVR
jgi:hypothetical protein